MRPSGFSTPSLSEQTALNANQDAFGLHQKIIGTCHHMWPYFRHNIITRILILVFTTGILATRRQLRGPGWWTSGP